MSWPLLMQAAAALAAVLALVLLAGRAARLRGLTSGSDPASLRLAATIALDARRRLHLLQAPGGSVLILTGGANDLMLPWPPNPVTPNPP